MMIGLDPALGVLHVIDYGRPSLALDLEEEFRAAIVDSVVLQAVNGGAIARDDFELAGEPKQWRLKPDGRKRFLGLYEARMVTQIEYPLDGQKTTWRRIVSLQAQQLARVFLGEAKHYAAMEIR